MEYLINNNQVYAHLYEITMEGFESIMMLDFQVKYCMQLPAVSHNPKLIGLPSTITLAE